MRPIARYPNIPDNEPTIVQTKEDIVAAFYDDEPTIIVPRNRLPPVARAELSHVAGGHAAAAAMPMPVLAAPPVMASLPVRARPVQEAPAEEAPVEEAAAEEAPAGLPEEFGPAFTQEEAESPSLRRLASRGLGRATVPLLCVVGAVTGFGAWYLEQPSIESPPASAAAESPPAVVPVAENAATAPIPVVSAMPNAPPIPITPPSALPAAIATAPPAAVATAPPVVEPAPPVVELGPSAVELAPPASSNAVHVKPKPAPKPVRAPTPVPKAAPAPTPLAKKNVIDATSELARAERALAEKLAH